MKNNCFYYSVFTTDGPKNAISDFEFIAGKNIVLSGHSDGAKQQIFAFVRDEVTRKKLEYTDFCSASGSAGVYCADLDFKIADKTFFEINENNIFISIDDFTDIGKINQNEIERILGEKKQYLSRAERFFSACRLIKADMRRLESAYINHGKINQFTYRLWQKISFGLRGKIGSEYKRYVTCPTADGIELNMEAFDLYCDRLLVIRDRTGMVSGEITDRLRRYALGSGYSVISCPCCLDDKIEHLIIPELGFGVFTSKYYHRDDFSYAKKTYAKKFLYRSVENVKQRTDFSARAYINLMNEAFDALKKAEDCDKELDELIYNHVNLPALKEKISELIF